MKIQKFILGLILFGTFVFIPTISANTHSDQTSTLEGTISDTSISNGTVTLQTDETSENIKIKNVPISIIQDINHQQNEGIGIDYTYKFTVYDRGYYKNYDAKREDNRLATYLGGFLVAVLGIGLIAISISRNIATGLI